MILPFTDELIVSKKFDPEMAALADRHYSREKIGNRQFMPPGKTIVIRNTEATLLFGWLFQQFRLDNQTGYNCCIFRNESGRLSSEIILESERIAFETWGLSRLFTYVDPLSVKSSNPGCCFKKAGWRNVLTEGGEPYKSSRGFLLLEKQ